MEWNNAKELLLKKASLKKAYEKVDLAYEIGCRVAEARAMRGLTQAELAALLDTKQPAIARLERGNYIPSLPFLQRVAEVLGTQLLPPQFQSLDKRPVYNHDFQITLGNHTVEPHFEPAINHHRNDYSRDGIWYSTQEEKL